MSFLSTEVTSTTQQQVVSRSS